MCKYKGARRKNDFFKIIFPLEAFGKLHLFHHNVNLLSIITISGAVQLNLIKLEQPPLQYEFKSMNIFDHTLEYQKIFIRYNT